LNIQYRTSYWEATSFLRPVDVAIIGGGLTGLQTALAIRARQPDWEIIIVERSAYGMGASTRNAGFACFGAPTEILEDIELYGRAETMQTIKARYNGIVRLADQYGAYCNYHNHGGYEVFSRNEKYQEVVAALPLLNELFSEATGHQQVWTVDEQVAGLRADVQSVSNRLEGQLHPGKLVAHLQSLCQANNIRQLYGLAVTQIDQIINGAKVILSNKQSFNARQIVLATNAFSQTLLSSLPIKPARNQVFVTQPINKLQLRGCFHHERGYFYFRNLGKDRILIGGARHLAGDVSNTTTFGPNVSIEKELKKYLNKFVEGIDKQDFKIDLSWSGIIAQGGKSPIVQRHENGWVLALRLSGMGVALSANIAQRAAAILCEE